MKAPCGHEGEPVIGTFVNCRTPGCDGRARDFDGEEDTQPLLFCCLQRMAPFMAARGRAMHCWKCGRVEWDV